MHREKRLYQVRAVRAGGLPLAGAVFMIERGTSPTPEIGLITDDEGRFSLLLPEGEFYASLSYQDRVAKVFLDTQNLPLRFILTTASQQGEVNMTVSNDSTSEKRLRSVSNDSQAAEAAASASRVIAKTEGNRGSSEGLDGLSARELIVRGTAPLPHGSTGRRTFESIIGKDERVRILDTETSPWRMIASLIIEAKNGSLYIGTGWFAGPKTVITAGHCVHFTGMGGWATKITVIPGRNAAKMPFNTFSSSRFSTTDRWFNEEDPDHDYAAIHMDDSIVEETRKTGWFSTAVMNDAALASQRVNVSGYPGDKGAPDKGCEQWFHAKQVVHTTDLRLFYDVDTMGGQSGAPVWLDTDEGPKVIGIHAYGVGGAAHLGIQANSAPRITEAVLEVLKEWLKKDGG